MTKTSALKTVHLQLPATTRTWPRWRSAPSFTLTAASTRRARVPTRRRWRTAPACPRTPEELGLANFHCSPAATINADGSATVGAVTATASFRFAKWLEGWFELSRCNLIIGKGGMTSEIYKRHFVPNNAIYLTTVGYGTGALLGRGIKRVAATYWVEELGLAQAIWVLEVENFGPFLVDSDLAGNSLFERENAKIAPGIAKLYAGTKPATMPATARPTTRPTRSSEKGSDPAGLTPWHYAGSPSPRAPPTMPRRREPGPGRGLRARRSRGGAAASGTARKM